MHTLKPILILLCLALPRACIEEYIPEKETQRTGTLVVQAQLSDKPGRQGIRISTSSTLRSPHFDPLSGCLVLLEARGGEIREFVEGSFGWYRADLEEDFLRKGEAFRLRFTTAEGNTYESGWETLLAVPEIDSVYGIREDRSTQDPDKVLQGLQFYLDVETGPGVGPYLRWELIETYEIRNPETEAWVYGPDRRYKPVPDSAVWRRCWITDTLSDIHTLDMSQMEPGPIRKLPLNFVDTQTRRLHQRYSLLVRQYALSQGAFFYWNELRKNLETQGGLFQSQPALTPSNLCNVEDPEEIVIGYFSLSAMAEKRVFVDRPGDLDLSTEPGYCLPGEVPPFLFAFPDSYLPIFLAYAWVDGIREFGEVNAYCIDCRCEENSTHLMPEWW